MKQTKVPLTMTVEAMTIGLRFAMISIYASLLLRVMINWRPCPVQGDFANRWWRATWLAISIGCILVSMAQIINLIHPAEHDAFGIVALNLTGMLLVVAGGVACKAAFNIDRGFRWTIVWPIAGMPIGFILLSLWGLR